MSIQEIKDNLEEFLFEELTGYMENRFRLKQLIRPDIKHLLETSIDYREFDTRVKTFKGDYDKYGLDSENMQSEMAYRMLVLKDGIELANPEISFSEVFSKARKRAKEDDSVKLKIVGNYRVATKFQHTIIVSAKFKEPQTLNFMKECFGGDQTYLTGVKATSVDFDLMDGSPFKFTLEDNSKLEIFKDREKSEQAYFLLKQKQRIYEKVNLKITEENGLWR